MGAPLALLLLLFKGPSRSGCGFPAVPFASALLLGELAESGGCDTPNVTTLSGFLMMIILAAKDRLGMLSDPCSKACSSISGHSLVASFAAVTNRYTRQFV